MCESKANPSCGFDDIESSSDDDSDEEDDEEGSEGDESDDEDDDGQLTSLMSRKQEHLF